MNESEPYHQKYFSRWAETKVHRHHLPHWSQNEVWCHATWRLADSIPMDKLRVWREQKNIWMENNPPPWDEETENEYHTIFSQQMEDWMDQGMGSCVLRDPENAAIIADALLFFNGERYELSAFAVMPNHTHVLFSPRGGYAIAEIIKSWKGYTAYLINKRMNRDGELWQEDYWDRLVRNERHFYKVNEYVKNNPEKAGLKAGFVVWEK